MPLKDISLKTKKLIIQEAAGLCGFCGENDVTTLEFHHILGKNIPNPHAEENLIYVCRNCHGKITAGQISQSDVVLQKRILKYEGNPNAKMTGKSYIMNFMGSVNTGTIAHEVHIHGKNGRRPALIPRDAIGTNAIKRNYLKYLIDRYHEFARAEKGEKYRFPIFYSAIKRKYGAKWDSIPLHLFEEVCTFVQSRIDKTVLGRTKRAHGKGNYRTFLEYCEKYVSRINP